MPAVSTKQRQLMAIAEHHPGQVQRKNRGVLKMSRKQLRDFASTKGLKHDTAPPGGFAHQGTTVEGPDFPRAERERGTEGVGANVGGRAPGERTKAFANAGTSREGPRFGRASSAGKTFDMSTGVSAQEHGFANAGSTREGYYTKNCATDKKGDGWDGDGESRIRVRRGPHEVVGRDRRSGDHPDGFRTHLSHARTTDGRHGHSEHSYAGPQVGHPTPHSTGLDSGAHERLPDVVHNSPPKYRSRRETKEGHYHQDGGGRPTGPAPVERRASLGRLVLEQEPRRGFHTEEHTAPRERANAETHYGLKLGRHQPQTSDAGGYEAGREGYWAPSGNIRGMEGQQGPKHGPGRGERHAFNMAEPEKHLQGRKWIAGAIKHPGALTKSAKRAGQSPMAFARAHRHDSGTTGRRARLAITLRGFHK